MSMMGSFRQASPAVLTRLRAEPAQVPAALSFQAGGGDVDDPLAGLPLPREMREMLAKDPELRARILRGFQASGAAAALQQQQARKERASAGFSAEELPEGLDIDKAWHGLHFLLCGSAGPTDTALGTLVLGGEEVGEDLGYGPARLLTPEQVAAAAAALESQDEAALARRFDASAMDAAGVYPQGWTQAGADALPWLLDTFRQVRAYFASARARGFGMLLALR